MRAKDSDGFKAKRAEEIKAGRGRLRKKDEDVFKKTSQELRMLSLSQAIHDHKVIFDNVVLNSQQCNQCLKCKVSQDFKKSKNFPKI